MDGTVQILNCYFDGPRGWGGEREREREIKGGVGSKNTHEQLLTLLRYLNRSIIDDRFLRDEGEFLIVILIGG